mgnify:FL=1
MSQILSQSDWYEIRAADESAAIDLYGDIGADWQAETLAAAGFVKAVAGISAKTIDVRINSYGGSVYDGLAIYNALRSHGAKIRTFNEGIAASIASLIYMAGDERVMAENAQLMIHAPWTIALGNANELRDMADTLDRVSKSMASSYASSGMDKGEILALLMDGKDHWYSADEAKEAGFATEVTERSAVAAKYQSNRFVNRGTRHEVSKGVDMTDKAAGQTTTQDPKPTQPVTPVAAAPEQKPYARSTAESQQLIALFKAHLGKPGIDDLKDSVLADSSVSPEAAGLQILAALGRDQSPARAPGIETVDDQTDKWRAAAADAILARTAHGDEARKRLQGNPYANMRLVDIARTSIERTGRKVENHDAHSIFIQASAMFTQGTGDFPVLLENVMHKVLLADYAAAPDTWSQFCKVGSVSDFRPHNRYRAGSFSNLDVVNEHGEFLNKPIADGEKVSIVAATKGNIINITRQALINDDMGAFTDLAARLGRAARRSIEQDVYDLLALNGGNGPVLPDGNTLFHASRANLVATGVAPTMASLEAMRISMANQRDASGNEWLDIRPAVALSSLAVGSAIRIANGAEYDPDVVNKFQRPNTTKGLLRNVIDTPRISGTSYYLFADPQVVPTVEVVFLNGVQEPYLEMERGFAVDGFRWKVRLDYGVGAVDWRGAIRNPGA